LENFKGSFMAQNKIEEPVTADKITGFIQKNRKLIFTFLAVIAVLLAGCVVFFTVNDNIRKKSISKVEEMEERFNALIEKINDQAQAPVSDIQSLLDELKLFARGKSGYAPAKAWSLAAQIHSEKKEWARAEEAWIAAAKAGAKTYLGPISLFNAAVCAEEQNKKENAIELYKECAASPVSFPQAPRAQISVGRLYEELGNTQAAIEAYRQVLIKWSYITVWTNLAHSRIIALEIIP
jgi:tetratricopeptide (TPR) repeat protein